jgi:asparagine synthase (glutamine-hydrolysing)
MILLWRDLFAFMRKLYVPLETGSPLPPWIRCGAQHDRGAEQTVLLRANRFSYSPQTIVNTLAWSSILETLPGKNPPVLFRYEYRFPFLDRDLVEYLFRVPLTQMSRPGRRRYMMRRALRGLVPATVLERPRKGFIIRSPLALLRNRSQEIAELLGSSRSLLQDLVDVPVFLRALEVIRNGVELDRLACAMRTINLTIWIESRNGIAL